MQPRDSSTDLTSKQEKREMSDVSSEDTSKRRKLESDASAGAGAGAPPSDAISQLSYSTSSEGNPFFKGSQRQFVRQFQDQQPLQQGPAVDGVPASGYIASDLSALGSYLDRYPVRMFQEDSRYPIDFIVECRKNLTKILKDDPDNIQDFTQALTLVKNFFTRKNFSRKLKKAECVAKVMVEICCGTLSFYHVGELKSYAPYTPDGIAAIKLSPLYAALENYNKKAVVAMFDVCVGLSQMVPLEEKDKEKNSNKRKTLAGEKLDLKVGFLEEVIRQLIDTDSPFFEIESKSFNVYLRDLYEARSSPSYRVYEGRDIIFVQNRIKRIFFYFMKKTYAGYPADKEKSLFERLYVLFFHSEYHFTGRVHRNVSLTFSVPALENHIIQAELDDLIKNLKVDLLNSKDVRFLINFLKYSYLSESAGYMVFDLIMDRSLLTAFVFREAGMKLNFSSNRYTSQGALTQSGFLDEYKALYGERNFILTPSDLEMTKNKYADPFWEAARERMLAAQMNILEFVSENKKIMFSGSVVGDMLLPCLRQSIHHEKYWLQWRKFVEKMQAAEYHNQLPQQNALLCLETLTDAWPIHYYRYLLSAPAFLDKVRPYVVYVLAHASVAYQQNFILKATAEEKVSTFFQMYCQGVLDICKESERLYRYADEVKFRRLSHADLMNNFVSVLGHPDIKRRFQEEKDYPRFAVDLFQSGVYIFGKHAIELCFAVTDRLIEYGFDLNAKVCLFAGGMKGTYIEAFLWDHVDRRLSLETFTHILQYYLRKKPDLDLTTPCLASHRALLKTQFDAAAEFKLVSVQRIFLENPRYRDLMNQAIANYNTRQRVRFNEDKQNVHNAALHSTVERAIEVLGTMYRHVVEMPPDMVVQDLRRVCLVAEEKAITAVCDYIKLQMQQEEKECLSVYKCLLPRVISYIEKGNELDSPTIPECAPAGRLKNVTKEIFALSESAVYRYVKSLIIDNETLKQAGAKDENGFMAKRILAFRLVMAAFGDRQYIFDKDVPQYEKMFFKLVVEMQRQYNKDGENPLNRYGKDLPMCLSGGINAILYYLVSTTHPVGKIVSIFSKAHLWDFIRDYCEMQFNKLSQDAKRSLVEVAGEFAKAHPLTDPLGEFPEQLKKDAKAELIADRKDEIIFPEQQQKEEKSSQAVKMVKQEDIDTWFLGPISLVSLRVVVSFVMEAACHAWSQLPLKPSEEKELKEKAQQLNMQVERTPGEGNRFFNAVLYQLNREGRNQKDTPVSLRDKAIAYVNNKEYKKVIDGDFKTVLNDAKKLNAWADDIFIPALCSALEVDINIIRSDAQAAHPVEEKKLDRHSPLLRFSLLYQVDSCYHALIPIAASASQASEPRP